jgi:ATP-binding cassette, subfamily B, bacterial
MSAVDEELERPYWRLDAEDERLGPWQLVRGLPATLAPVVSVVARAAPRPALVVLVLQAVAGLASAFGLLATTGVLEELLAGGPTGDRVVAAVPALLLVVGAFTLRGVLETGVSLAQAVIAPAVRRAAEERLYDGALSVELAAFDDAAFYDRMHRARDRSLPYLERSTADLVELMGAAFAVAAAATALAVLHPVLLPVLALGVLPDGWAMLRAARMGYASMTRTVTLDRRVRMVADLATRREPAAEVRACQARPFVLQEYRLVADVLRDEQTRTATAQAMARATGRACSAVGAGATLAVLGLMLHAGWVPLAVGGTALLAVRAASADFRRIVLAANQLVEQGMYVRDYQEFLRHAETRTPRPSGAPAPAPRSIVLRDVRLRYPGAERPALDGIDLTLRAGQTIALVGENGSGKTTLAKVIASLYRPDTGTVRWDGTDLATLDPHQVADRVMLMQQDPVRWPHSARANVRIGRHDRPDPDGAALRAAAAQAGADDLVAGLPRGWDTLLSKYFRDGHELSGGQWQRLAVARGLFRDAPLLIWDEPTAALDARAEHAVYESLRRIAGGRTVVLITHRLASVRGADRIYLLHDGRVAEQGTHQELVAAGGRYAELYALQAAMYGVEVAPC